MFHRLSRLSTTHATWRAFTATIAAVAAVCGSFAYAGRTPAFVADPAASFVVDVMPAAIVNPVLDALGSLAQPASFLLGLALVVALLAGAILLPLEVEALADVQYLAIPLTLVAVWLVAAATTNAPIAAVAAAVPAAAVVAVVEVAAARDPLSVRRDRTVDRSKRATLQAGFGTLTFAGLSAVAGRRRTPDSSVPYLEGGTQPPIAERTLLSDAEDAAFDLPDAPGLVSEIGSFYTVDINTIDPIVERDDWSLSLTGAVDSELTLAYDDLRDRDADRFYSTLRCVGEDLNDREMDMAVWTGVPVADLLEEAGPTDEAEHVVAHAVDGYWNTITLAELERSYLVYGMNGRLLPREHGHPVRLLVPGNWGEVNVKWIDEIELVAEDREGYWEERGWDGTGEVETVAKLWSVDREGDAITVGGHAYGGLDGIDAVEVSTDGGDTWTEAELSPELGTGSDRAGRDTWRQWRYEFEPTAESHEVVVRAIDGSGAVQTETPSGSKPDGATGWVSQTIEA
ncbi:molybdopterin-dependent oxidoreductase [Halopiger goleimassiliensis]|uniref:molybdopterin-dependent oxidoreductase n=1 Tax=Halopiger goleimassiliensis TaxID=1293048 RepID=UPI000678325C|nr:molybdopterin-dependent oxidoreductase [Halopiger goleimassiliensis]